MRIIGEYPHDFYKVTAFAWNSKILLKIEDGLLEQTYKYPEYELSIEEIPGVLSPEFYQHIDKIFESMDAARQVY